MEGSRIIVICMILVLIPFWPLFLFRSSFYGNWSAFSIPKYVNWHQYLEIPTYRESNKYRKYETRVKSYKEKKCENLQHLKQILLAVNYNFPHYSSIPILKAMYAGIFGKLVFCGNGDHPEVIKVRGSNGYLGYDCVANAIRMFPNFTGYLHTNDDVILNWWNLMKLDSSKIWTSIPIPYKDKIGNYIGFGHGAPDAWWWWNAEDIPRRCDAAFNQLATLNNTQDGKHLERYFKNTGRRYMCTKGQSDVFYIPREFSKPYVKISDIFSGKLVFLEAAVPTILLFFLTETNTILLNGAMYLMKYGYSAKYLSGEAFYESYSFNSSFIHPFKLDGKMKIANRNFLKNVVMIHGEVLKRFCSVSKKK